MRTTVRLDELLLKRAKRLAADRGMTLTAVLEEALTEKLARTEMAGEGAPARRPLPTFAGRGVRPGVDLHDGAALEDLMTDDRP